jgi:hypothetical protein
LETIIRGDGLGWFYRGYELSAHLAKRKKMDETAKIVQDILASQGFSALIKGNKVEFLKTKDLTSTKGFVTLDEKAEGTLIKAAFTGHISYIGGFIILGLFLLVISFGLAIILVVVGYYLAKERAKHEMTEFQQTLLNRLE